MSSRSFTLLCVFAGLSCVVRSSQCTGIDVLGTMSTYQLNGLPGAADIVKVRSKLVPCNMPIFLELELILTQDSGVS